MINTIVVVIFLLVVRFVSPLELKKFSTCQTALGMQSGAILDTSISASSSYDLNTVGPKSSRARTELYGGAWCPLNTITSVPNEWLQIEFDNLTYLTQVESQGRFDNGRGKEFADFYRLKYTRTNDDRLDKWIEYRPSWIRANQNTFIGEIRQLNPPIVAKRLRFYPVSHQPRTVCMRVEVYGCLFTDNIVSYSMSQGRIDVNSLGDDTYDGHFDNSTNSLVDGLGQLSDGVTGTEDLSLIDGRQPWIGWSNDSLRFVSILFEFETIRQMNRVKIHVSNLFSKEIFIFKTAVVSFSTGKDETNFSKAIIYQHHRDEIFEIARPILIELNQNLAKFVRLDFYFDSKWILISEITFDSQIPSEKPTKKLFVENRKRHREIPTTTPLPMFTVELSLAFVIGASLAIGFLLVGSSIWIFRQKKKLRFRKLTEKPAATFSTLPIRQFYDLTYADPEINFYSTFSPKISCRCAATQPSVKQIEGPCGNVLLSRISMDNEEENCRRRRPIVEIKFDELIFREKLAEGKFGSIHIGETKVDRRFVVVKMLNEDFFNSENVFRDEIELWNELTHPSICSFIAVVNQPVPMAVIESFPLDLFKYLREQTIPLENSSASTFLLSFACQIASAMKYLSSKNIVHRDLATRNCLISTSNLQIHLSDIGICRNEYVNDYARVGCEQTRLAIRWAAWETIYLGEYSIKSDVWAFGVTLFEIFTFCRQRPFHKLTNEEFLRRFASHSIDFHEDLPQPSWASKEIYDMMCECWQIDHQRRPSFAEIHQFLVGRSSGGTTYSM